MDRLGRDGKMHACMEGGWGDIGRDGMIEWIHGANNDGLSQIVMA